MRLSDVLLIAAVGVTAVTSAAGCSDATSQTAGPVPVAADLRLTVVASGLSNPVDLTAPPGDPRLFVVEQEGRILIIENGVVRSEPFLDIRDRVRSGGERGLLGLAFHPEYAATGSFFVNYTGSTGATRIERYSVSGSGDSADPSSAAPILEIPQPFSNHNGGQVFFDATGMLLVGLGDGGGGGDPLGSGQDRTTLLGSLLRLDVDGGDPYAIPADNPYARSLSFRPEIWAWGLRNPWRSAIDPVTNLLYIADVGQNRVEEISVAPADQAGLNYGWNTLEGSTCFITSSCDPTGTVLPALEYEHSDGCSVTGGRVYRGAALSNMVGMYFYADFCEGWIRSFRYDGTEATDEAEHFTNAGSVAAFGEDSDGELYVLTIEGQVFRLDTAD
jgi:glucose/arabinose dehydrogenase